MRAFVIRESDAFAFGVDDVEATPSSSDDVLVRVDFSGVNFKDALVAMPHSRVRRITPLVGGVDAAGTVVASNHVSIPVGAGVAVHGGDMGVARHGGFAEFVYAPAAFVNVLAPSITTRDAMIIGTAGFTAMASVLALEDHGLRRANEVLVTGATGGVGSMAVALLAARGFQPVASTGSIHESTWLHELGATRVIGRDDVTDREDRVLGSELWDGAIDCVGGTTLASILRSLRYGASVAASGLVASADLATNVYPFITRAVNLLGIDAVQCGRVTRDRVWSQFAEMSSSLDFERLVDHEVRLDELPDALEKLRSGATRGRILVNPAPR